MGARLATIDGPKRGEGLLCPFGGDWVSMNTMCMVWAEIYLCTKCHVDPPSRLTKTDMGSNWDYVPFREESWDLPI